MNALATYADCEGKKNSKDPRDKIKRQKSMISQLLLQNIRLKEQLARLTESHKQK